MKRILQVKLFEGDLSIVENEINEFIKVFSPEMIRDIKMSPGSSPGAVIVMVYFDSVVF